MEENHSVSFTVDSSWIPLKKEIKEAFFVEEYQEGAPTGDPSDFINLQSCVQLSRTPGLDKALSLQIKMDGKEIIRKVSIICEAPIVEVHCMFEEYIKTIKGEKLEEVDGTTVYLHQIDGIKTNQLLIKFVGMKGAGQMWLLGVRLMVASGSTGSRLEELLARSALSEKAKKFRSLAKANFWDADYTQILKQTASSQAVSELRNYIDSSIQQMEQRVIDNIQQQVRELEERQNERLDSIIKLLTSQSVGHD